jgi:hypothetical protein
LKTLAKGTPEAETKQTEINQSIYEIAKEILSSQQTESPTSENVKRKRGRPKGSKSTPKSDALKNKTPKTPKSKRLAELQQKQEEEELSNDDKPVLTSRPGNYEARPEIPEVCSPGHDGTNTGEGGLSPIRLTSDNQTKVTENEELSDDDKPILDIITKEFEEDLQNQASE